VILDQEHIFEVMDTGMSPDKRSVGVLELSEKEIVPVLRNSAAHGDAIHLPKLPVYKSPKTFPVAAEAYRLYLEGKLRNQYYHMARIPILGAL
jgi:hypothetical protein